MKTIQSLNCLIVGGAVRDRLLGRHSMIATGWI